MSGSKGSPGPVAADRPSPPTIRDVARAAGVSTATVSRVLAGIGNPRQETAEAVRGAVATLDYRPSGVARSLRMKRTRTLGLIVTDIQNPFFPELVRNADLAARGQGYSILLGSAAYDEHRAMHYLSLMVDRRVDGLIIASSQVSDESLKWLLSSPVPAVIVNAEASGLPVPVITSDNVGGARLAVEHLLGLGHRRIAYVHGPSTYTADAPRAEGFRRACRDAGLPEADTPEVTGDGLFEGGERAAGELLRGGLRVTAIVCYNDITAIGVLRELRAAHVGVPAEVSVIGVDDIAAAAWVVPALTTVAQQKGEMGRIAVERLVAAIEDPAHAIAAETVHLPMVLRERESTGPAPLTDRGAIP
jgi:LacI family transcriptional regulator, galactose operon repressor